MYRIGVFVSCVKYHNDSERLPNWDLRLPPLAYRFGVFVSCVKYHNDGERLPNWDLRLLPLAYRIGVFVSCVKYHNDGERLPNWDLRLLPLAYRIGVAFYWCIWGELYLSLHTDCCSFYCLCIVTNFPRYLFDTT